VLDRPVQGRVFFEEVIRDNLDLGRPDQVQLIFDRRVSRSTPGRSRTRVITQAHSPAQLRRTRRSGARSHVEGESPCSLNLTRLSTSVVVKGSRKEPGNRLPYVDR
jgi:hypothetical protein